MNKEFLHMQKLAGIITEGEYNAKMNENNNNHPILILLNDLKDNNPELETYIQPVLYKVFESINEGDDILKTEEIFEDESEFQLNQLDLNSNEYKNLRQVFAKVTSEFSKIL